MMDMTKEHNGSVTDSKGYRWLYDVKFNDSVIASMVEEEEADRIVNEHDTLKAKAELFDEMREQLGKSTIVISTFIPDSDVVKHNQELLFKAEILAKAKELK